MPLVLLHGWSGSSESLKPLADWLSSQGIKSVDIFLGDYISMNDEITLQDLGFAFQRALSDKKIPQTRYGFDLIVHSTGGLVAREYLRQICQGDPAKTPIHHLCMLAPANFGSPLATMGKSYLGRIFLGWDEKHLFQTGKNILDALELASPYTWKLAKQDIFDPGFNVFSPKNTIATIMVGTARYTGIGSIAHENGSDGTVRVSTANLNAHCYYVDFSDPKAPALTETKRNFNEIAFAVFDRNHKTILSPDEKKQTELWGKTLLNALQVDFNKYQAHVAACKEITKQTFSIANNKEGTYNQYMHLVFRVHDQFENSIDDYFIEFYQEEDDPKDKVFKKIHSDILEKVTTNKISNEYRSFLMDCTDLDAYLTKNKSAEVKMSISAADLSDRIGYRKAPDGIDVFNAANRRFYYPNEPVLVDITLYRDPSSKVFELNNYQM